MKRTEAMSVGDIIDRVMFEGDNSRRVLLQRASYLWIEVVGPGINSYTTRRYVTDDGVLHVYLSSAPLKNELSFCRSRLVSSINEALGQEIITDICFH